MQAAMIEQQIQIVILAIDNHTLLAGHEAETVAQLDDELLQVSNKAVFKVSFAIHTLQACKLQEIRALEHKIRRHHIIVSQGGEFLLDKLFWLAANGCALVEHAINLCL